MLVLKTACAVLVRTLCASLKRKLCAWAAPYTSHRQLLLWSQGIESSQRLQGLYYTEGLGKVYSITNVLLTKHTLYTQLGASSKTKAQTSVSWWLQWGLQPRRIVPQLQQRKGT